MIVYKSHVFLERKISNLLFPMHSSGIIPDDVIAIMPYPDFAFPDSEIDKDDLSDERLFTPIFYWTPHFPILEIKDTEIPFIVNLLESMSRHSLTFEDIVCRSEKYEIFKAYRRGLRAQRFLVKENSINKGRIVISLQIEIYPSELLDALPPDTISDRNPQYAGNGVAVIEFLKINSEVIEATCKYNHMFFTYLLSEMFSSINKRWPVISKDKNIVIVNTEESQPESQKTPMIYVASQPGRGRDAAYDKAYAKILSGMDIKQAYSEYLSERGLKHEKSTWDSFKQAIRRRTNQPKPHKDM